MKYCKTCKLHYQDNRELCLFCNNELETIENSNINNLEHFPKHKKVGHFHFIIKLISFILIISTIICGYIDYVSLDDHHLSWSYVVLTSTIYLILMLLIISKEGSWINKTIWSIIITILNVVFVGLAIDNYYWAIDFVLPFALIFDLLFLSTVLIINKKSWFDFSYYLIILCLLGIIPSILNFFDITHIKWPSTVCLFVSISVFLGLFFLKGKSSIKELKRRFHI